MSAQLNVKDLEDPCGFRCGTELPKRGATQLLNA